ncbi:hypothetical protein QUF88_09235 [Bacillus sp. DX1.1]|uniref:hypothetical protein n=1 Tax=unclassified Bacillus (in: firmicutes) TaxID=185979 RepID=UPI00256FCD18|nr:MULTISPECIES: hypothetical protein [unclassified Bacillus (in: firmicutes)]MDM5154006.1 hypothetical protein [Bacillus sp. DX1.1]WJE82935.1 hypothetical protein QRE67_06740 [Bacillus sp. DX3.1]
MRVKPIDDYQVFENLSSKEVNQLFFDEMKLSYTMKIVKEESIFKICEQQQSVH